MEEQTYMEDKDADINMGESSSRCSGYLLYGRMTPILELYQPDMCYEFSIVRVDFDPATDTYYYSSDAGCSCPTPFEDHTESDLSPLNAYTLMDFDRTMVSMGISLSDRHRVVTKLRELGIHQRSR